MFIFELFPDHVFSHCSHLVDGVKISHVIPAGEFGNVPPQVLFTEVMVDAVFSSFEHGPEGVDAVGRYPAPYIFLSSVID